MRHGRQGKQGPYLLCGCTKTCINRRLCASCVNWLVRSSLAGGRPFDGRLWPRNAIPSKPGIAIPIHVDARASACRRSDDDQIDHRGPDPPPDPSLPWLPGPKSAEDPGGGRAASLLPLSGSDGSRATGLAAQLLQLGFYCVPTYLPLNLQ